MELVKRVTLHYRSQQSDKVYEVDLCKIGEDKYLVNFRYGRRGKNLKEGSKTVQAVSLTSAEKIFNKLIADKQKKGYQDVSDSAWLETPKETPSSSETSDANTVTSENVHHQAIIDRLQQKKESKWPLDRAIWRAGELKIKEAVPFLIPLIEKGNHLRNYCIAWALGKCGDSSAMPELKKLATESGADHVKRIAGEALYQLANEQEKEQMRSQKLQQLPEELRNLAQNGNSEDFTAALQAHLDTNDYKAFAILDTLYQVDNEYIRPALIGIVKTAPLKPNYFKQLRHIFKMAEYRRDAEIFGILAYRFEMQKGVFNNFRRWEYDEQTRRYKPSKDKRYHTEQLKKAKTNYAYSVQTRDYLRRRVWRTLRTLGKDNESQYVNLATGVLLQYSDADGEKPKHSSGTRYKYDYRAGTSQRITYDNRWDRFASRINFNHILYENSSRYEPHNKAWLCKNNYKPGNPAPQEREEAFPQLWDQHPEALLQLLLASKCLPVHEFAIRAIQENQPYCDRLEESTLIELLGTKYQMTVDFAFQYAQTKYNPDSPSEELVLAVVNCISSDARQEAYRWIEAQRQTFLASSYFIAQLVTSQQAETRIFARRLLSSAILDPETAQILIARIIGVLLQLDERQIEMIEEVSETLLVSFAPQLRTLGFPVILDLIHHPVTQIKVLGARILLNHQTPASELPSDLIESLLASPEDSVRSIGIRIFGQLPDAKLMDDRILIVAMAVNASEEIRQAIRPIIERLAQNHPQFGYELAIDFIDLLTEPERHQGVHKDLQLILRSEMIPNWMSEIATEKIFALIKAKSTIAQELGGIVLASNSDRLWTEFSTSQLVQLANHEIVAIRQASWQMMERKFETVRHDEDEMLFAIKLLEAKWEDSQEFARSLFEKMNDGDWTPKVMVGICDSTQEDVRRFGRDIVASNFQTEHGQEYLLKFSEHPTADMQMFVTNYLETYVVDNLERLQQLVPYFVTVLSGVNKGSVAKKRIFLFLEAEGMKCREAAEIVADILMRQSVTMSIVDKATAIRIMVKLRGLYGDLQMPIRVKEVLAVRN